ncbi:MAG: hypothetical protein ACI9C3_002639 [Yoonia sp.]|jgi:hypothetical protein
MVKTLPLYIMVPVMITELLDRARPSDPPRDYCLWDYARPVAPQPGALRTSTLLFQSFVAAGVTEKMRPIMKALQSKWGRFNIVWGAKYADGQPSWEFYFYDYARDERALGMQDFIDAMRGLIGCALTPDDTLPYFMFSIELTLEVLNGQPLDQIDVYMGNPGSTVSSGICYGFSDEGLEMRNFYFFFDAATQMTEIKSKIAESIHFPYQHVEIDELLWPEMQGVETIVVANKRQRDGIYFSRISASQLEDFLHRLAFPESTRSFLRDNHAKLNHHLYDAGWDFRYEDGQIIPTKGSFYGLL